VIFLQSLTLLLEIIQSLFPPEFQEEFPAEPGCSSAPLTWLAWHNGMAGRLLCF